jgi:hypothetical protein
MVWAPNPGINYPFTGGGIPFPLVGTPNFRALDTNNDSVIDIKDDPYMPYYPGDQYVDWVGISAYWYIVGDINNLPDAGFFADQITATGPTIAKYQPGVLNQANRNFYQRFCVERNKPMIVPETAAPYVRTFPQGDATEAQIKLNWVRQLLGDETMQRFPKFKAIAWFEEMKTDAVQFEVRDWRITDNTLIRADFVTEIESRMRQRKLVGGTNFTVSCSGEITLKI